MSRALQIDKAGRLKISEAHVSQQIEDYLRLRGWTGIRTDVIRTRSERGFIAAGNVGQADMLYLRPIRSGLAECFWCELKRPRASTDGKRKAKQAAWQEEQTMRGFLCYRAPDGCADPFAHFQDWYLTNFEVNENA